MEIHWRKVFKYLGIFLAVILLLSICVIVPVDRTPYKEKQFYTKMDARLDSLAKAYEKRAPDSLRIGMARVSITPAEVRPLAGYGARKPMEFDEVLDSVFVRAVVLTSGQKKCAILSADLLIIHPEMTYALLARLAPLGWTSDELFLSATHTHSSVGGWAPGRAGEIFAGTFQPDITPMLVERMAQAVEEASARLEPTAAGYINNEMGETIKNRLIRGGAEDAWMRNLFFRTSTGWVTLTTYAAHATCFGQKSHALTGDYPAYFHKKLAYDSLVRFSQFMAGAVASMGPEMVGRKGREGAKFIGESMAAQLSLLANFGTQTDAVASLETFKLKVPLRAPQLKISKNLKIRPWVFRSLFGDHDVEVAVLKLNNTLIIGLPCDFSGELAIPLYEYARSKKLNLMITSFNGGYIGYVTQDDRYDMEKYETRTMNWYGPDSGAYFSEIITRVIDILSQ